MNTTSFFKSILFCLTVVLFASCDKDFNEIGSDIIGDDHFGFEKYTGATVLAYNQKLDAVQSNNLPINALGFYNSPAFGKTTANFLTQVELVAADPTFTANMTVTKVQMDIPYFSTLTETNDDGSHEYELDSIYGATHIKLEILQSNYYLRDFDPAPGLQTDQKYYSDFNIGSNYNAVPLNDGDATQNIDFFFSNGERLTPQFDENGDAIDPLREAPGMRIGLNKDRFQQILFSPEAAGKLANNNVFKDWFRGLYFKVSPINPEQGSMSMINFAQGKITVTYMQDVHDAQGHAILDEDGNIQREEKALAMKLTGNTVNIFDNVEAQPYLANTTTNVNTATGDPLLYLKGQQGSMAVIDLFGSADVDGNGIADELDQIRSNGWMINEANLTFYIDNGVDAMATGYEPYRIYLYDLNNKRPLLDYYTDVSVNAKPKFSKKVHDGIIQKEATADGRGIKYKIRLTNHIKNLVDADIDSTNVRLGLTVTESINTITSARLKTPMTLPSSRLPGAGTFSFDRVPTANIINPLGTVLYGSSVAVPEDKRLKLEIYYTKPD
ncbi:MAG TPA: DUF4270 domain-containing protein [Flavobacterium sp.]|nr:DUF4270 domain-containing protein [Flavobacterium sp.]